jgi:hypothetical protein
MYSFYRIYVLRAYIKDRGSMYLEMLEFTHKHLELCSARTDPS